MWVWCFRTGISGLQVPSYQRLLSNPASTGTCGASKNRTSTVAFSNAKARRLSRFYKVI